MRHGTKGAGAVLDVGASRTRFEMKALDAAARTFEGLAATWDLDLGDDVIHRGAFREDIAAWKSDPARVIQLLDTHDSYSIFSAVGKLVDARETADGLWTKWKVVEGEDGDRVLARISEGIINKMSIGYKPVKYDYEESEAARFGVVRHLRKLELSEVSLVLRPMNPAATIDTDSVKSLLGRSQLSIEQVQTLRDLHRAIGARLDMKAEGDAGEAPPTEDEPLEEEPGTDPGEPAGDEEEGGQKAGQQDPAALPPADEEGPDVSALDRLRLRRLGHSFNTQTQEA